MADPTTQQVAPGVYRYADGLVNWYLLEEEGELTLVDAGWPRSWPNVEAAIGGLGHSVSDVSAIVLTHAHPDHLGAAEPARKATGAPVYVHREEVARATAKRRGPLRSPSCRACCRPSGARRRSASWCTRPHAGS